MRRHLLLLLAITPAFGGCAATSPPRGDPIPPHTAPRPGYVNHVVFFELNDPADAPALIADCDRLIGPMPIVAAYACGPHLDAGRESVLADYDVGLFVAFGSTEAYDSYVTHPDHVELVETWRPRIRRLRVHDFADATP